MSAPLLSSPSPSGEQSSADVTISVTTDEPSACKTGTADNSFENLAYTMAKNSDTTYSYSASGLANGDYAYYVRCNDTIGNKHTSSLMINFSVSVTTTIITSSSGGGGGGGGGGPSFSEEKLATVKAGGEALLEYSQYQKLGVSSIRLNAKNEIKNAKIKVKTSSKPYSARIPISSEDGRVFKYLNIIETLVSDEDINNATITFKIPVSWFNNTNLSTRNVRMLRLVSDSWTNLTTKAISFGKEYHTYEAVSPGFSVFSIIAEMMKKGEVEAVIAAEDDGVNETAGITSGFEEEFGPVNESDAINATGEEEPEYILGMSPWISAIAIVFVLLVILAIALIIHNVGKK